MERIDVVDERWDYLIVLDACRYDYFEQEHQRYLKGDLSPKMSMGSCTDEWRDKSFPDYYDDIVYISANPQICATSKVYGYCAGDHFHEVYEIWKDGWDEEKGTVLPETLTQAAIRIIRETSGRGKRYIIHYLQPHAPYVASGIDSRGYMQGDINKQRQLVGADTCGSPQRFRMAVLKALLRIFRRNAVFWGQPEWYFRRLLALPPANPMEASLRSLGRKGLQAAYRENLIAALQQVAVLVENVSGRVVVTSDHGELLGERICYGHPRGKDPILTTIPWLVIEKESGTEKKDGGNHAGVPSKPAELESEEKKEAEQKQLAEKLKALGYYD